MKLMDLYISDNIEALDQVATSELSKYDKCKFQSMSGAVKALYRGIILNLSNQEKCYILTKRFLVLIDRLKRKYNDPGYVQVMYAREIREAERIYNNLREELIKRYAELAIKLGKVPQAPATASSNADDEKLSEESEIDEFDEKIILMEGLISPKQLYKKIMRNDNILVLDIRPENDFDECTLDFKNLINIPPQNITDGISANLLGQKMPAEKKQLWDVRDEFQAIVLMDWNSNVSYESKEISIIKRSLTDWDFNKIYKYPPILLNGGFYEYIETYPTGVTNVNFQYDNRYYMLDDMLDLDSIAYPEELATSYSEGPDVDDVCSELNILHLAETQRGLLSETPSDKFFNIPHAIARSSSSRYDNPRPGPSTRPDTPTPSPSEESIDSRHLSGYGRVSKRCHSSDESDEGDWGTPVYIDGKKVATRFFIDPEKVKRQMETDRLRELEKARLPPKPGCSKGEDSGSVLAKTPSGGGLIVSKFKLDPNAKEYTSRRVIAKRRNSLDGSGRGRVGHRRPSVPNRNTKPVVPVTPEPELVLTEIHNLDDMQIVGLVNINNTCYMNALIQCFRACPPLRALLETDLYKKYMVQKAQILPVLANLFYTLKTTSSKSITPMAFYNQVKAMKPSYGKGAHEDCMEFFIFLLNALVDDTTIFVTEEQRRAIDHTWHGRQQANRSIFMDLFYYQMRTDRVCHTCKTNTAHIETDNTLMLAVPNYVSDLRDLMNQYTHSFSLADFVCTTCKKPLEHTRKFLRMPPILVIVLKRYFLDKDDHFYKNSERVTFPLRKFDVGGVNYRLVGMAVHDGTMMCGHYTAIVLDSQNQWIECNDEHVSAIDINSPRIKNLAYAFIYNKSD